MSIWLALAVVGQFLNAVVALIDKYVVTSETFVFRPFVYAFWISVLSVGSVVVFLFGWIPIPIDGLSMPTFARVQELDIVTFGLALVTGYAFFTALLSFFEALKNSDASDVVPVVGGLTAFFTLLLSFQFLEAPLPHEFFFGFMLLMLGTLFLSRFRFTPRVVLSVVHAGLMFGLHYVAFKALTDMYTFDHAFFWSRCGLVFVALSMLLIPDYWHKITVRTGRAKSRDGVVVLGNKVLAGIASLLILKAMDEGNVALVQALGGLQYLFLLVIGVLFGSRLHRDFGENLTFEDMLHKIIAIPLIAIGFFLLFI